MLVAEQIALEVVRDVRPVLERVRKHDRSLFDQARRAASSIVLNIAEAQGSAGGNTRARYHTAAGSARELSAALQLAIAWGYTSTAAIRAIEAKLYRVRRLLWGLHR